MRSLTPVTLLLLFLLAATAYGSALEALWRHPIVGAGATSGELYIATRHRRFSTELLPKDLTAVVVRETVANCSHWIVTTTINSASPNLQNLASFPGWCKCVVLDHKSPPGFNLTGPGVVVLTVAEQEKLVERWAVAGKCASGGVHGRAAADGFVGRCVRGGKGCKQVPLCACGNMQSAVQGRDLA